MSELIRTFHKRLEQVRGEMEAGTVSGRPVLAELGEQVTIQAEPELVHPVLMGSIEEDLVDEKVIQEAESCFHCPICTERMTTEPVSFRGKEMCQRCMKLLRGF